MQSLLHYNRDCQYIAFDPPISYCNAAADK